jgi:hypothetical protein
MLLLLVGPRYSKNIRLYSFSWFHHMTVVDCEDVIHNHVLQGDKSFILYQSDKSNQIFLASIYTNW